MLINDKFFNDKLTAEQRKVLKTAAIVAGYCGRSIQQLTSAMGVSSLREKGMEIYSPTTAERAQFKKLCGCCPAGCAKNHDSVRFQIDQPH